MVGHFGRPFGRQMEKSGDRLARHQDVSKLAAHPHVDDCVVADHSYCVALHRDLSRPAKDVAAADSSAHAASNPKWRLVVLILIADEVQLAGLDLVRGCHLIYTMIYPCVARLGDVQSV